MAQLRKTDYDSSGNEVSRYDDHATVLKCLEQDQQPEIDNREHVREAHMFLDSRRGQWEDGWWNTSDGKPRYTFDKTNPIVEQVSAQLEKNDYSIQVKPTGSETSEDDADLIAGIVRSIENNSQARTKVYRPAARGMIAAGVDGWEVVQEYLDADSFDQDLKLVKIHNWSDRVWFDAQSEEQDHSDATRAFKMTAFTKKAFKERWPKRSTSASLQYNSGFGSSTYFYQRDLVIVGTIYYVKNENRELALMSDGSVFEVTDQFIELLDQYAAQGIQIVSTRKRPKRVVYTRMFDGNGWIDEPKRTVFSYIPLIPCYANFKVIDNKILYRGVVEKLLDPQRVYNYAMSRHVEEVALAPRKKIWLTEQMVKGYASTIQSLNTNTDPVQFFNFDDKQPQYFPQETGGPQVNEGILSLAGEMSNNMNHISGMFAANMGDNPNLQSGVAIDSLKDTGEDGNSTYETSMEIAIAHTFRVIVDAIPRVYSKQRQMRIVNEDMTDEIVTVNEIQLDPQTLDQVVVRDLTKGKYSITCKAGPSYQSRQQETRETMLQIAQVRPQDLDMGADIFYKNIPAPGMDQIGERFRRQMFLNGLIPFDQLTDQEKQELQMMEQQKAEQGDQPDPAMVIAQAEMQKAQADNANAQTKLQQTYAQMALQGRKQSLDESKFQFEQMLQTQKSQQEQIQSMVDILKGIREAMGVDAAMSPDAAQAYGKQAERLNRTV